MRFRYLILISFISLFIVSIWFKEGYQLGTAEGGLPFNNLVRHSQIFKHAWADTLVGNATGISTAAYPTYKVLSIFEVSGIPGYITEAVVFWLILVLSGVGIFLTGRKIIGLSDGFSMVAVFHYWLAPYVLVNIWNRFLYNHIFFFALLPLVIYFFMKGIMDRKFSYAIFSAFVCVFLSYSLTALALTVLVLITLFVITLYFIFFEKNKHSVLFISGYFLLFVAIFVLQNFWWISQLINFINSPNYIQSVNDFFSTEGNIAALKTLSAQLGNFNDISRFMHNTFYYQNSASWSGIYSSKSALVLSSLILTLTLSAIYFGRKNKLIQLFGVLFLISVLLSKGSSPPFGEIYTFFFSKSSLLQLFRNPFEKISLLTVYSATFLFSYSLQNLNSLIPQKLKTRLFGGRNYLAVFAVMFLGTFWGYPLFTGIIFTNYSHPYGVESSYRVNVPDYYEKLNQQLNSDNTVNRFLALPILGEGITHNWTVPFSGIDLYSTLFSKQSVSFNTTIPYYQEVATHLVNSQLSNNLMSFLPFFAIDEIVLRRDIDYRERSFPDPETSGVYLDALVKEGFLKMNSQEGSLSRYSVNDDLKWGKFYITNKFIFSDEKDLSKLNPDPKQLKNKVVYIPVDFYDKVPKSKSSVIAFPTAVNKYEQVPIYSKMTNEELSSRLFYVRHDPDNFIYPLVRSKELLTSMIYFDYPEWVLFNTNLLGKRVVEICRYTDQEQNGQIRESLITEYMSDYYNLKDDIENIVVTNKSYKNEILESLSAQAVLLSRCGQIPFSIFHELFVKLKMIPYPWTSDTLKKEWIELNYSIPKSGSYFIDYSPLGKISILDKDKNKIDETENLNSVISLDKGKFSLLYEKAIGYQTEVLFQKSVIDLKDEDFYKEFELNDYESDYQITFDYQTPDGDFFALYMTQNNDRPLAPRYFGGIALKDKITQYKIELTPSVGATRIKIGLTGDKNKFCYSECVRHENLLHAKITNFAIIKKNLQKTMFSLKTESEVSTSSSTLTWEKISPVNYRVFVDKKTDEPEFMVFSELFSGGWQVQSGNELLDDKKHFLVNGYANGWVIEAPGTYSFNVRYQPEDLLNIGKWISILAILISGLIGVVLRKKYEI